MNGYYVQEKNEKGSSNSIGRLSIDVKNIPEFYDLINQVKTEADQLKSTIDRLRNFELDIGFSSSGVTSSGQ